MTAVVRPHAPLPMLLDRLASLEIPGGADRPVQQAPLLVVLEAADSERRGLDDPALLRAAAILPVGSRILCAGAATLSVTSVTAGGQLEELVPLSEEIGKAVPELVRERAADVLLVSDQSLLNQSALSALTDALSTDSVTATVSVIESASPLARGIPPPGVESPVSGAVLARRDRLVLAIDEAEFRDGLSPDPSTVVGWLLGLLVRPGFVHRVTGAELSPEPARGTPPRAAAKRRPIRGGIVIEGWCLGQPMAGTQTQMLGLVEGLLRIGSEVAIRAPRGIHPSVAPTWERLRAEVQVIRSDQIAPESVVHHPHQFSSFEDLRFALSSGERVVLTHQDMILYRTPSYAAEPSHWTAFRSVTRAALASVDQVGFFSLHAALDAASDGLVDLDRATVVPLGVDHLDVEIAGARMAAPDHLEGRPFILVIGSSYVHKNRLFALRLVERLATEHGWDGGLVFAGGDPGTGSSLPAEQRFLHLSPGLSTRVVDLGRVNDADRVALYRSAALVLFPSLYEGFGLVPFEAAAAGTACVYSWTASMRELLPAAGALPSLCLDEAAPFVYEVMGSETLKSGIVSAIGASSRGLTWENTARGYLEVYARAFEYPARDVSRTLIQSTTEGVAVGSLPVSGLTPSEATLIDVVRRRRRFGAGLEALLRVTQKLQGWRRAVRAGITRRG